MKTTLHTTRRDFLKLSGAVSLGFLGLNKFAYAASHFSSNEVGYGPLVKDPQGMLNLPKGFSYKIISKMGTPMSDGFLIPGKGDGMATFAGKKGKVILIRNHEMNPEDPEEGPFGKQNELLAKIDPKMVYDFGMGKQPCLGGTTTLIFNEETQTLENEYLSLVGTVRNCAGGPTPWGSWISCEETNLKKGESREKDHGYNFEVPASTKIQLAEPIPLIAMGRMNHEAVAVDPKSGIVYQTEDQHDGLIYRFIPHTPGKLIKGGKLQILAIKDQKSRDTRNWDAKYETFPVKQKFEVEWLDIDDVESPEDDLRLRGFEKGAARFARGEGMWYGNGEIYFACTNGGKNKKGQIFRYVPSALEGTPEEKNQPGTLELFVEPNDLDLLQNCDNLTVAPWADVITCEDRSHPNIVGISPEGEFYKLAENIGFESEFAGGVFSPSGKTFFVNIQHAGLTFAITGPWKKV
ncbi:MAG: DUF839 domain-containing protein [Microscillaceae bacterium]|nr:DUF839 domain-containing protein [Microscillaceae bacterium]